MKTKKYRTKAALKSSEWKIEPYIGLNNTGWVCITMSMHECERVMRLATPDLLEAAKKAWKFIHDITKDSSKWDEANEVIKSLSIAIAKVEGKSE